MFRREEWAGAAEKYREAALLGGPLPVYLSNLAACLLKLDFWDLADSAATRALMYDPRHVKALYRRALARKELDRYKAVLAGTLLSLLASSVNTVYRPTDMLPTDLEWLLTIEEVQLSRAPGKADRTRAP